MQVHSLISALLLRVALLQSGDVALDGFALLLELFHRALQAPTADTRTRHRDNVGTGCGSGGSKQQPLGKHARRGLRMERARQEESMLVALGRRGAHMSFLMNSTRLVTLFFTSTNSCLTSTGPINLKTDESSSRSSSSCDEASAANV